jgi:hypothetical protein
MQGRKDETSSAASALVIECPLGCRLPLKKKCWLAGMTLLEDAGFDLLDKSGDSRVRSGS